MIFDPIPPAAWPALVERTAQVGFGMPSDAASGALLRMLAASKPGGRLLELGTGTGLATAWLLDGMDTGARLVSVDNDATVQGEARAVLGEDSRVAFIVGDGLRLEDDRIGARLDRLRASRAHRLVDGLLRHAHRVEPAEIEVIAGEVTGARAVGAPRGADVKPALHSPVAVVVETENLAVRRHDTLGAAERIVVLVVGPKTGCAGLPLRDRGEVSGGELTTRSGRTIPLRSLELDRGGSWGGAVPVKLYGLRSIRLLDAHGAPRLEASFPRGVSEAD